MQLFSPCLGWVLEHDEDVVLIGRDHDLVVLGPDAQERELVVLVQLFDDTLRLGREVRDERRVLNRLSGLQGGLYRDPSK